jgi:hypothetical protein
VNNGLNRRSSLIPLTDLPECSRFESMFAIVDLPISVFRDD